MIQYLITISTVTQGTLTWGNQDQILNVDGKCIIGNLMVSSIHNHCKLYIVSSTHVKLYSKAVHLTFD